MKRVLSVYVESEDGKLSEHLFLPASHEEIADVFDRTNNTLPFCKISSIGYTHGNVILDEVNLQSGIKADIFEANHLATLVGALGFIDKERFAGAVLLIVNGGNISIADMINITMNVQMQGERIYFEPVKSFRELGELYIDNNQILELEEEIESLSPKMLAWLKEHLDEDAIGRSVREQQNGILTDRGYTAIKDELKPLYDGNFPTLVPADFVFKLGIAQAPHDDEPNDENLVELKLPAPIEQYFPIIHSTGARTLSDCVYYEFEGIIPKLELLDFEMEQIESLNQLAKNIQTFKENGTLPLYKAMLETMHNITLETAISACNYVEDFGIDTKVRNYDDYGRKLLMNTNSSEVKSLCGFVDTNMYGRASAMENGVKFTPYGLLESDNGMTLVEKMEQAQQTQTQTPQIGGIGI